MDRLDITEHIREYWVIACSLQYLFSAIQAISEPERKAALCSSVEKNFFSLSWLRKFPEIPPRVADIATVRMDLQDYVCHYPTYQPADHECVTVATSLRLQLLAPSQVLS